MEMRTGSPSHVRRSSPQLHEATRVVMAHRFQRSTTRTTGGWAKRFVWSAAARITDAWIADRSLPIRRQKPGSCFVDALADAWLNATRGRAGRRRCRRGRLWRLDRRPAHHCDSFGRGRIKRTAKRRSASKNQSNGRSSLYVALVYISSRMDSRRGSRRATGRAPHAGRTPISPHRASPIGARATQFQYSNNPG